MQVAQKVVAGAIVLGTLLGIAWFVWWQAPVGAPAVTAPRTEVPRVEVAPSTAKPLFRCDGRTECTQMTSCEEAMFFLKHCPRTGELDQDKDGIPCEIQWCQR